MTSKKGGVVIAGGAGFGKTAIVERIVKANKKLVKFLASSKRESWVDCRYKWETSEKQEN